MMTERMRIPIEHRLAKGTPPLTADGAKGTYLEGYVAPGMAVDILNMTSEGAVEKVLAEYTKAGAELVQTCTFGANRYRLQGTEYADQVYQLNRKAAEIARKAVGDSVYVAGDIGPLDRWIELDTPDSITMSEAIEAFTEQIRGLIDGGVDVLHIETMSSLNEAEAAFTAKEQVCSGFPTMVTMTFQYRNGLFRTISGVKPEQLAGFARKHKAIAYGANCGVGPDGTEELMELLRGDDPDTVLVAKFNAGIPRLQKNADGNYVAVYTKGPADMAQHALSMKAHGVKIIGTCCGSTPEYTAEISRVLNA